MKVSGTSLVNSKKLKEVTDEVEVLFEEENIEARFFLCRSGLVSDGSDSFNDEPITWFLSSLFEGEAGTG
ncbi:hypothetical protein FOZ63_024996, partial [Perkinsus olseni]